MKTTKRSLLLAAALALGAPGAPAADASGAGSPAQVTAYPDGGYYKGEQAGATRSGHGIYLYPDQSLYVGQWLQGEKDGWGLYKWPSGNIYEGEWRSGRQHGAGVLTFADGGVFEGRWVDGAPQDNGTRPAAPAAGWADPETRDRLCRRVQIISDAYREIAAGRQGQGAPGEAETWALEDRCR